MDVIRKDATITNTDDQGDDSPGSFEVVLSTPAPDRDGDELKSEDWEQPLPEHITFDVDHGMDVASTVGSGVPTINDDGRLVVAGNYSSLPRAQDVRTLVREGHIRTVSVAFLTKKVSKGGQQRVVRELLNGAFVAVPSNREAVVLASKSAAAAADPFTVGEQGPELQLAGVIGAKTVAGSFEQRQQALCDALDAAYPDPPDNGYVYAYPLATFDTSVVYRVSGDTEDRGQWQADYSIADDGTVTLGEPRRVTMVETVVPVSGTVPKGYHLARSVRPVHITKSSASPDGESGTPSAKDAAASAAAASDDAAAVAAAAAEADASEIHRRAVRIRAMSALASLEGDN